MGFPRGLRKINDDEILEAAKQLPEMKALIGALLSAQAALDHVAPGGCRVTGPSTGNPVQDLIVCPRCVALAKIEAALAGFLFREENQMVTITGPKIKIVTSSTKRIIIKQSIDIVVSYFGELYRLGKSNQWVSYLLESIECEIGLDALKEVRDILEQRLASGRW